MPSFGKFFRDRKAGQSTSGTTTLTESAKRQSSTLPTVSLQRSHSMASIVSLKMFRKKDKSDKPETADGTETRGRPRTLIHSRTTSAANSLPALPATTPINDVRPSKDIIRHSNVSGETILSERRSSNGQSPSPQVNSFPSTPATTPSPHLSDNGFLSLSTSESHSDSFQLNIDFAKFENTKVDVPAQQQNNTRIANHEFLLIVDDGAGIDHRAWDSICDIVTGLTKRLLPSASKEHSQIHDLPVDAPAVSLRFVNNYRHLPRIYNLNQIRHIFNWITPRDAQKHPQRHPPGPKPAQTPPIRTLEYYFWNTYNEKLQKNAWVGQVPTTIILFSSSPLSNRPEDMDLFVAKCAEKLNANQVPLTTMSIIIVQCNTDANLQRQLADTRRMIVSEWYTPKPKVAPPSTRKSRGSMLNPQIATPRQRPQRDWVDIITCAEWQRAGPSGIKNIIEEEIQRGSQRRKTVQKELALNYLTHLGKENSSEVPRDDRKSVDHEHFDNNGYISAERSRDGSPATRGKNGYRTTNGHASTPGKSDYIHRSGSVSTVDGGVSGGRTAYYD